MQFSVKLYWITLTENYNFLKNTTGFDLACCFASVKEVFNFFLNWYYILCVVMQFYYILCVLHMLEQQYVGLKSTYRSGTEKIGLTAALDMQNEEQIHVCSPQKD